MKLNVCRASVNGGHSVVAAAFQELSPFANCEKLGIWSCLAMMTVLTALCRGRSAKLTRHHRYGNYMHPEDCPT